MAGCGGSGSGTADAEALEVGLGALLAASWWSRGAVCLTMTTRLQTATERPTRLVPSKVPSFEIANAGAGELDRWKSPAPNKTMQGLFSCCG